MMTNLALHADRDGRIIHAARKIIKLFRARAAQKATQWACYNEAFGDQKEARFWRDVADKIRELDRAAHQTAVSRMAAGRSH